MKWRQVLGPPVSGSIWALPNSLPSPVVSWHFWITIHLAFRALHLQLIGPTACMATAESLPLNPSLPVAASVPAGRRRDVAFLTGQFWVEDPLQNPVWASCMTGWSSGYGHSVILRFTQSMTIFCLFQLIVLLLSLWNGYNILKSWHVYYISKRVSLYSQTSIILWAVNRKTLWKPASILACLGSYLNKDCVVFTLWASALLLRCSSKLSGGLDGAGWRGGLGQVSTQGSSALAGRCLEGWLQLVAASGDEPTRSLAGRADVLC